MRKLIYYLAKIKCKLMRTNEPINDYYRSGGVKIGNQCLICSYLITREPFLIEIGNNVIVSTNVTFCTHDNSAKLIFASRGDLFGRIIIGDNCFIGQNVTLMYGVTLSNNVIVAAGSVVTKSFTDPYIIIGGNPARKIGTWEQYKEKYSHAAINRKDMERRIGSDDSFLVIR